MSMMKAHSRITTVAKRRGGSTMERQAAASRRDRGPDMSRWQMFERKQFLALIASPPDIKTER
jgi:hypothetical protein